MKKHVIILGGGISGLSLRYFLSKRYPDLTITLLEKSDRLGGLIRSQNEEGFFFELGPRTFKASKSHALLELIQELGLEEEIIVADKKAASRFIWKDHKLWKVHPFSPLVRKIYPALLKEWKQKPAEGDESVYDFICRRLNPCAVEMMDAMATGIYAGDIRKLSILSCFPKLKEYESRYGSITRGLFAKKGKYIYPKAVRAPSLFTLQSGLSSLVAALAEKGRGKIHLNFPVEKVGFADGKVKMGGIEGDHLFCALSARGARELAKSLDSKLYRFFDELEMASLSAVQLGFDQNVLKKRGFGYLVPSSENEKVLGAVFDSSAFPTQNSRKEETRLTVMVRGCGHPKELLKAAIEGIERHLDIRKAPSWYQITPYPEAIPQFPVGYEKEARVFQDYVKAEHPSLTFLGNYMEGVSISDCIRTARTVSLQSNLS